MEYNSTREQLVFPEYGRNVQDMIRTIRNEQDDAKRQQYANAIVNLMGHLAPAHKNAPDQRPKLWKHFFAIAEYNIDVVSNEGIRYTAEEAHVIPSTIPYPEVNEKFRHYGNHVRALIERAAAMEDGPKKSYFISLIGSFMKMAFKTYNKDHFITDEGVIRDLKILSKGKLNIEDETSLDVLSRKGKGGNLQPQSSEPKPQKYGKHKHKNRNRHNNNDRFRRRK